ncbi:undecaprenyl-diphosphate phosphatase [Intrasporangium calvum]|uniref:Undecaprenyl-diphosphatase n=1 Tax=Intrasporangium calvum (strain ATCC 23552 / DSM 43043 / JCM 3097 / NBRC 12989 / NCIMB 10167 / NRRL B-3866 / 7 KIP) TaxID=710696 RepID=E6SA51_INTC7|nr:undecaprenyl-diphosphate phosphatase [Intrasporangium calvum]ADU48261.1 Undecaprenyl-diphosphatase [Intrasporangium calvum DSM 43043]AXG13307.1 undecaprenyl-diphosphate phosphatase [Intrasporangium calvum]
MADLSYLDAVILGIVEGLTEYLPVSSTGHLTITEKLLGLAVDDPAVTAYTAVIQLGAIAATLIYFFTDIVRFARAWFRGLSSAEGRHDPDYGLAWAVVIGSLPVGLVGFLARDLIEGALRSLWVVAAALVVWSVVMVVAERMHTRFERRGAVRGEHAVTPMDGFVIGLVQCFSLIPGVSRSGATISAGLARGIDRVTATRLSFFLAIPALSAAGVFQAVQQRHDLVIFGVGPMLVGLVVAFVVAYASIAWLLRFVASNSLLPFVWYRVALGVLLAVALGASWIGAS